ncbi:MAG: dTMP kinase [Alphaproteobacteria bacterium]|nr:dTMP kinase [Alphaproteobacteria bacterium]
MNGGFFISFEGGEGSGKTTQISQLAEALKAEGYSIVVTREPGGTPEGESIRSVLVQRDGGDWLPMAEVMLLYAARLMHIEKVIKPAMEDGCIVISDRFSDSTLAYQGYGHGLPLDNIRAIEALTIGAFKPNLTFMLDIDPKTGLMRSHKQLIVETGNKQTEDRFERLNKKFHDRLRQGYLNIAKSDMERCRVINAKQDIDALHRQIKNSVDTALKKQSIVENFKTSLQQEVRISEIDGKR